MNQKKEQASGAHRYETSRPWGVAGLTSMATAMVVLLSGGIAHALEPLEPIAIVAQLKALAEDQVYAVDGDQSLRGENGGEQRRVAELADHWASHQYPPRSAEAPSRVFFNGELSRGFPPATAPQRPGSGIEPTPGGPPAEHADV